MADEARYHHGNLREALIEAAMGLVEEQGPEGVSLRATARAAGVSHAAPYHHFADKAQLMEALTVRAFERFTRALSEARISAPGDALSKLGATGVAYVLFAADNRSLFRLMNRPEMRLAGEGIPSQGPVERAAAAAFAVLLNGIEACQAEGLIDAGDPKPYALTAWSLVHGLAVLIIDGLIERRLPGTNEVTEMARTVTEVLGRGLLTRGG